ncbi:MAG: hypothetical protein L6R41_005663 [Letrouitia leprolyta]|nr:MAG: hypothetical protein L6R41_005663 [Letrouitia leprolyta]
MTQIDYPNVLQGLSSPFAGQLDAKSKTLSGGQKRKLRLAMMFAGGSTICCVDEVSSGLDPLSRRKIRDILLAQRKRRTIIMTTHFLDEADFLSDHIAILFTSQLQAGGSSADLKHKYGEGYSIHVPDGKGASYIQGIERKESIRDARYAVLDSINLARAVDVLEGAGVKGFRISGPTIEDVFLKILGRPLDIDSSLDRPDTSVIQEKPRKCDNESLQPSTSGINLHDGKYISLGCWRLPNLSTILRGDARNVQAEDAYTPLYSSHTDSLAKNYMISLIGGPSARITVKSLAGVADIYSSNHTVYGTSSIDSVSTLKRLITTGDS